MNPPRPSPTNLKPAIEKLLPRITTLRPFQWQCALDLWQHRSRTFLMKACGSGKTFIWITLSILYFFVQQAFKGTSHTVLIVSAPLNQIIIEQIKLVQEMKGWRAYNFADNPEECEQALTTDILKNPTIIFWNPHEATEGNLLKAIKASKHNRIGGIAYDEAGTVVDWGTGEAFRPVLSRQINLVKTCEEHYHKKMPFIVFTGVASLRTRETIDQIFLGGVDQLEWDRSIITSPFGTDGSHIALKVIVVRTREQETSAIKKGVANAYKTHPAPGKITVLVPYVKNLKTLQKIIIEAINTDVNLPITEGVSSVFAGDECVNKKRDLDLFTRGGDEDGVRAHRSVHHRVLLSTFAMMATGSNIYGIAESFCKGQPSNVELMVQAWYRVMRRKLLYGTIFVIASWWRRLELKFLAYQALVAKESSEATRRHACNQLAEIDELSYLLLFPDEKCILRAIDTLIMGGPSQSKPCTTLHRNNPERMCSSCAKKTGGSIIHDLQEYVKTWCKENEQEEPVNQDWAELTDGTENCITGVRAKCLVDFVKSQGLTSGGSRVKNIALIRQLLHPTRLNQHSVGRGLETALPTTESVNTMGGMRAALTRAVSTLATEQLVEECLERLIMKKVLQDRPPTNLTTKDQAAAHPDDWLISRGHNFSCFVRWPLLQPPARQTSRVSLRAERQKKQKQQQEEDAKKKKVPRKKKKTSKKKSTSNTKKKAIKRKKANNKVNVGK